MARETSAAEARFEQPPAPQPSAAGEKKAGPHRFKFYRGGGPRAGRARDGRGPPRPRAARPEALDRPLLPDEGARARREDARPPRPRPRRARARARDPRRDPLLRRPAARRGRHPLRGRRDLAPGVPRRHARGPGGARRGAPRARAGGAAGRRRRSAPRTSPTPRRCSRRPSSTATASSPPTPRPTSRPARPCSTSIAALGAVPDRGRHSSGWTARAWRPSSPRPSRVRGVVADAARRAPRCGSLGARTRRRVRGGPGGAGEGGRLLRALPARRDGAARGGGAQPQRGGVRDARREGPRGRGRGRRGLPARAGRGRARAPARRGREPGVGRGRRGAPPRRRGAAARGGPRRARGGRVGFAPAPGSRRTRRGSRRRRARRWRSSASRRVRALLGGAARAGLDALLARDEAFAAEAAAIGDVVRLVHYHRDLGTLLRNFVVVRGLLRPGPAGGVPGGHALPRRAQLRPVRPGGRPGRARRAGDALAHVHRLLRLPPPRRRDHEDRRLLHAGRLRLPHGRPQRRLLRPAGAATGTPPSSRSSRTPSASARRSSPRTRSRCGSSRSRSRGSPQSKAKATDERLEPTAAGTTDRRPRPQGGAARRRPSTWGRWSGIVAALGVGIGALGTLLGGFVSGFMDLQPVVGEARRGRRRRCSSSPAPRCSSPG